MNDAIVEPEVPAASHRCNIEEVFARPFIELIGLAPKNPVVRGLILSQTGKLPGPERETFEQIKEWVETTCNKRLRSPHATHSQAGDGFTVKVEFSDTEYGRANYSVPRSGTEEFTLDAEELLQIIRGVLDDGEGLDTVVHKIGELIDSEAWDRCNPNLDDSGDYSYDQHDSTDSEKLIRRVLHDRAARPFASLPAGTPSGTAGGTHMKLIKLADAGLSQTKEVAGLLSCHIDYEIKSGTGQLDYTGPKFSPRMWHQVLSFFRWTNKEMDSESQVRLYVNLKLGRWGAWAFPQEARTGLSAREIVMPETPEQAVARFASWDSEPSGDWLYFCTVHHHCSATAFQSGTDEENERNQDGLHLTVGRMEADRHDLHARFYLGRNCFEPDLSRFWPVEPSLAEQVPPTMLDELARFQMCEKVVVDFPDAWRRNVIETKQETWALDLGGHRSRRESRHLDLPVWLRSEHALREIIDRGADSSFTEEDYLSVLHSLAGDPVVKLILEACLKYQVLPEDFLGDLEEPGLAL